MLPKLKPGFSLVECIVYLTLLSLLSVALFRFATDNQLRLHRQAQSADTVMALYAAADQIAADLAWAPADQRRWKKQGNNTYFWSTAQGDVGWLVKKNKLVRIVGSYDSHADQWRAKKSSIVAGGIAQLIISPGRSTHCYTVTLKPVGSQDALAVDQVIQSIG